MEELKTEVVQEKFSGPRKGFYYNPKLGGYVPAKGKPIPEGINTRRIIFIAVCIAVVLVYIFRAELKSLFRVQPEKI